MLLLVSQRQSVTDSNILDILSILEKLGIIGVDKLLESDKKTKNRIKHGLEALDLPAADLFKQLELSCGYSVNSKNFRDADPTGDIVTSTKLTQKLTYLNPKRKYNNILVVNSDAASWRKNVLTLRTTAKWGTIAPIGQTPSNFDLPPRDEEYNTEELGADEVKISWLRVPTENYTIKNEGVIADARVNRGLDTPDGNFVFCFQKYKFNEDKPNGVWLPPFDTVPVGNATLVGLNESIENLYNTIYSPRTLTALNVNLQLAAVQGDPDRIAWKSATMQLNNYPCVGININTRKNNFTMPGDVNPPRFIYSTETADIFPYKQICCHICSQQCYQRLCNIEKIDDYNNIDPSILHHTDKGTVYCGEYHKLEGTKKMFTKLKEAVKHIYYNIVDEGEAIQQIAINKIVYNTEPPYNHDQGGEEKKTLDALLMFKENYTMKAGGKLDKLRYAKNEAVRFIEFTTSVKGTEHKNIGKKPKFFGDTWPGNREDEGGFGARDTSVIPDYWNAPYNYTLLHKGSMDTNALEWIKQSFDIEIAKLRLEEGLDKGVKRKIEVEASDKAVEMIDAWLYEFRNETKFDSAVLGNSITITKPENIDYWLETKFNEFTGSYCIGPVRKFNLNKYLKKKIPHFVQLTEEPKKGFSAKLIDAVNCGRDSRKENSNGGATDTHTTIKAGGFIAPAIPDYNACLDAATMEGPAKDVEDFYKGWTIKTNGGTSVIEKSTVDGHITISTRDEDKEEDPLTAINPGDPYVLTNRIPEFLGLNPGLDIKEPFVVHSAVVNVNDKNYLEEQTIFVADSGVPPPPAPPARPNTYSFDKVEHVYLDERKFKELTEISDQIDIPQLDLFLKKCGVENIYENKNNFFKMYNIFMGIEDDNYANDWVNTEYYKIHLNPVGRENYGNYEAHKMYYDSIFLKEKVIGGEGDGFEVNDWLKEKSNYPFELFNIDDDSINAFVVKQISIADKGDDNIFEVYKYIYGILYLLFNIAHYIVGSPAPPDSIVEDEGEGIKQRFGIKDPRPSVSVEGGVNKFNYGVFTILDNGKIIERKDALNHIKDQLIKLQFPKGFINTIIEVVLDSVSMQDDIKTTLKTEYTMAIAGGGIMVANNRKLIKGGLTHDEEVLNKWLEKGKIDESLFSKQLLSKVQKEVANKKLETTREIINSVKTIDLYRYMVNPRIDQLLDRVKRLYIEAQDKIEDDGTMLKLGITEDGDEFIYISHGDMNYGIKYESSLIQKIDISEPKKNSVYINTINKLIYHYIIKRDINLEADIESDIRETIVVKFQKAILKFLLNYLLVANQTLDYFKSLSDDPVCQSLNTLYSITREWGAVLRTDDTSRSDYIAKKINSSGDDNLIKFLEKYNEYKVEVSAKGRDLDSLSHEINSGVFELLPDYFKALVGLNTWLRVEENIEGLEAVSVDVEGVATGALKAAMDEAMKNSKIAEAINTAYASVKDDQTSKKFLINVSNVSNKR
jgi:hypothetical protein